MNPDLIAETIAEGVKSREPTPFNSQPSYDMYDNLDDEVCVLLL